MKIETMKAKVRYKSGVTRLIDVPVYRDGEGCLYLPQEFVTAADDPEPRNVWVKGVTGAKGKILEYREK